MSKVELPQLRADEIEWDILSGGRFEYSRGDYQADASFEVNDPVGGAFDEAPGMLEARYVDDCFDHLEYRARTFSAAYRFDVSGDVISKQECTETDAQFVYRFLLACSRPDHGKQLSLHFTELCKVALQRLLGHRAQVWNVDAGSADRKALGGETRDVASALAVHLGAQIHQENIDDLPLVGGDGGSDLVATFGFDDKAHGALCILGQCAASRVTDYWRDKIYQPMRFRSLYHWSSTEPKLAVFVPVVYRKGNGAWLNNTNVVELMFDRIRIMKALDLDATPLDAQFRSILSDALDAVAAGKVLKGFAAGKKRAASKPGAQDTKRTVTAKKTATKRVGKKVATKRVLGSAPVIGNRKRGAKLAATKAVPKKVIKKGPGRPRT